MAKAKLEIKCVLCGLTNTVECDEDGLRKWEEGEAVQVALPELNADDRELLISNICPKCFDNMFPDHKED